MTPDVGQALLAAVAAVDELGLRYAVVGGLALGAWGVDRSTRDADLYADLSDASRAPLQRALEERGFHVPAMSVELERYRMFRSRSERGVPVDVFADIHGAAGPLKEAILDRRKSVVVAGQSLWFVAPEELAVLKALSPRPRDFRDLTSLVAVVGADLDAEYVLGWTKVFDEIIGGRRGNQVTQRVESALAQRGSKGQPSKPR